MLGKLAGHTTCRRFSQPQQPNHNHGRQIPQSEPKEVLTKTGQSQYRHPCKTAAGCGGQAGVCEEIAPPLHSRRSIARRAGCHPPLSVCWGVAFCGLSADHAAAHGCGWSPPGALDPPCGPVAGRHAKRTTGVALGHPEIRHRQRIHNPTLAVDCAEFRSHSPTRDEKTYASVVGWCRGAPERLRGGSLWSGCREWSRLLWSLR